MDRDSKARKSERKHVDSQLEILHKYLGLFLLSVCGKDLSIKENLKVPEKMKKIKKEWEKIYDSNRETYTYTYSN